jgi:hypothetical protein
MEYIANEKNLNQIMFNISKPKKFPLKYPIEYAFSDSNKFVCHEGIFNNDHWTLLDVICTCIIHCKYLAIRSTSKIYNNDKHIYIKNGSDYKFSFLDFSVIPPSSNSQIIKHKASHNMDFEILSKIKDSCNDIYPLDSVNVTDYSYKNGVFYDPVSLVVNTLDLRNCCDVLKKYSLQKVNQLLDELSKVKLSLSYTTQYLDKGFYKYIRCFNKTPSRFFTVESIVDKDDNHKIYTLTFDTFIGHLLCQNLSYCNVNFIPSFFYSLSKESQLFYKSIILPDIGKHLNKKPTMTSYNHIIRRLNLRVPTKKIKIDVVNKILDELVKFNFIETFSSEQDSIEIYRNTKILPSVDVNVEGSEFDSIEFSKVN